tara:strand:- start:170 stop:343 length:174 start_codon:yes stop_codon:yes gene_type:complete
MNFKLTSVKVKEKEYIRFKKKGIESGVKFQQLVNISIKMYNENKDFRKCIEDTIKMG